MCSLTEVERVLLQVLTALAKSQTSEVLLQGDNLLLRNAEFLDPLLRAAGFSWDDAGVLGRELGRGGCLWVWVWVWV